MQFVFDGFTANLLAWLKFNIFTASFSINSIAGFFDDVDKCSVAAGYDYNDYDYEFFW